MLLSKDKKMNKFCFFMAGLHLLIIFVTLPLGSFNEGWNFIFVWGFWFLIDLPVSILNFVLFDSLHTLEKKHSSLKWLLYPPYFIHGVLGTIWWFYLPRIYYGIKDRKRAS
ncbi:MAG: hypothetical protein AAGC78_14980 [Cellvibrio sp.]|uniref:hypothetical protein n=1 Tax=Cellvibrio sp. TaxID=1965322 RepID=UPI0031A27DDF